MVKFEVANYKFSTEFTRSDDGTNHLQRVLELNSVRMSHGIVVNVKLLFSTYYNNIQTRLVGFHQTVPSGFGSEITCWMPEREYDEWLDIVRVEKPVYFHYDFTEIGNSTYLTKVRLSTSEEVLGEGMFEMEAIKKVMKEALQETSPNP